MTLSGSARVILACTIILVVFLSASMFFMWSYLQDLSQSPLNVGARKVAEANGVDDVMCTCQLSGIASPFQDPTFYFNTTTIWSNPKTPSKPSEINFSNFILE